MDLIRECYERYRCHLQAKRPKLHSFCERYKSWIKFVVAGTVSGGTDLILLFIFYGLLGMRLVPATSAAFVLSFLVSFSLQKLWTFRNTDRKRAAHQLGLYFLFAFVSLNLNGFLMHFMVYNLRICYIISQIAVNLFLGVFNYVIMRFLIFRKHEAIY